MNYKHVLIIFLYLIRHRGQHFTAKELSMIAGVSIRTVYRIVNALCELLIPINICQGPYGAIWIDQGYKFT